MPAYGTYMSESQYIEDGYGLVTERVVVASTYSDLFMNKVSYLASQPFVDILRIGSSKKDISLENGSYAEDELSIKMKQAEISNTWENLCYELVLQAQDVAYPLYIGYFIQPDDTSLSTLVNSAEFIGIIQPEFKAKEIVWRNRTEFDPDTNPLYEWEFKAKSFDLGSFDGDSFESLLNDVFADTTWRSNNISDRLGYCDLGGGKVTKFANLVNLNTMNTKINAVMAARMSASIGSTFSIIVDECTLDEKFSPARWMNSYTSMVEKSYWDDVGTVMPSVLHGVTRFIGFNNLNYRINENDAKTLKLGEAQPDIDSPFLSSFMYFPLDIHTGTAEDGSPQKTKTNSFVEKEGITFAEYYIGLAASFGLFVRFYYTTATELHIKFIARATLEQIPCFIPDATESDLTTNSVKTKKDVKKVYANANKWCGEGNGVYRLNVEDVSSWNQSSRYNIYDDFEDPSPKNEGDKIFLSISPNVRLQTLADAEDIPIYAGDEKIKVKWAKIPHNAAIYHPSGTRRDSTKNPDAIWNSIGLHTAIYVKIVGIEENIQTDGITDYYVNYGLDGDYIWSPVAAGHYKFQNTDKTVYKQADYVNAIRGLDEKSYITEKNLTIPYLCRFRKLENGTDTDDDNGRGRWQNMALGVGVTLNSVNYIVVGIERNPEQKNTKIRLWNTSNFAFSDASGLSALEIIGNSSNPSSLIATSEQNYGIAFGNLEKYQIVIKNSDGTYSKALPINTHAGKYAGIAMNDALNGEPVFIIKAGESFDNPDWNFTTRVPLYLRYNVSNPGNISSDILTAANANEDVVLLIGYGEGSFVQTIDFTNINNQLVFI